MVSVLNTIDTGHEDMIHGAEVDYYGLRLATCSSDNSVKIFDIKSGAQTLAADLKGHCGPVWQVAWAHPRYGNIIASCSYDRKVIIWKEAGLGDWNQWFEYSNHDSSVNSVAWAPAEYGLILACGSSDGSISILTANVEAGTWDSKKISNAHSIGCNTVSWCPATTPDAAFDQKPSKSNIVVKRLVTGGCDNSVKIWKEEGDRWEEDKRLELHSDWVRDVAWAPNVGLPRYQIASCSQDRRVIIWTSEDLQNWQSTILNHFDDVVWNVSWSLTGNLLAVSGGDNKISLWRESNEGQWICISEDTNAANQTHQLSQTQASFVPEQRTL
ncbi:protein SEC13 homolog [Malaya genurostris]|uniref:protein SEC13 homolog n=1 Tax=Malaya genurostris TaxID=325434 RepID=UPI0026F3AF6F|nr:protein SEC13 homolog [Malaya genurostris]